MLQAGGFPIELPAMSLSETMVKPSTMLYRNFLAMETEELLRCHPLDGAVLMGGCDKTTPGLVMGAISMGIPAIYIPAGPMLRGNWKGEYLGSGSDIWKYWTEKRAGNISDDEWNEIEGGIARSFGTCMVMGTAATMMAITEALGLALPGSSSIPAADSNHPRMCGVAGRRIVEMVWEDLTPDKILTPAAFDNAIKVHMAMGGSTNAIIHVVAMARRAGIPVDMETFDRLSRQIPVLANVRPSGKYLMEDFFYAGGLRAMMQNMREKLDLSCLTVTGKSIGENIEGAKVHIPDVIHSLNDPIYAEGATAVLKGNLAPNGCVIKPAAADPRFLKHRGKAIAFEDYNHMMREIERDDLDVTRRPHPGAEERRAQGRPRHAGMGHAADPQAAAGAGRARHDPHLRRPHERHELRRLHPARRAGKLRRRAARIRADRRRDRDRRRQADDPSARQRRRARAPQGRLDAAAAEISARLRRDVLRAHRPGRPGLRSRFPAGQGRDAGAGDSLESAHSHRNSGARGRAVACAASRVPRKRRPIPRFLCLRD